VYLGHLTVLEISPGRAKITCFNEKRFLIFSRRISNSFGHSAAFSLNADTPYRVEFIGVDEEVGELLFSASQSIALQDSPPATEASLRKRVDDDVSNLLKALQSLGYYNAMIKTSINRTVVPFVITFTIDTGPIYPFASFEIRSVYEYDTPCPCEAIIEEDLDIYIGSPALPSDILNAEDTLLSLLEKSGYPLANIVKREVIACQLTHSVSVILHVDTGPLALFGETDVCGNKEILPIFFARKITWKYGTPYNPCQVQRTLNALELCGLFSTINITHDNNVQEDGTLPMHIVLREAKPRSIAFGVGYATDLGAGLNFEWEHRNMRHLGERLSLVTNFWQIRQEGFIKYVLPDCFCPRQDLIWTLEAEHEDVKAFREISYSFSGIFERQITDNLRISYGGMFTRLQNTHSNNNGEFNLIRAPLQIYWKTTDSLLDPTEGAIVHFKTTPSLQMRAPCFAYSTNILYASTYYPFDSEHRYVLAGKATLGSIWGANKHTIPPSERFYAGSDTLLRGYHYLTVSPLNERNKPIGGRSVMVYSLEMRMRVKDPFGLVLFYDVGNVYAESLPQINHKQLQSAGLGVRYHTPVGPIRLDIAFPFNPRLHLDKSFQVYFSIGQTF